MKCRANILLTAYAEAERSSKCKKTWVVQKFSEDVTITPLFFVKTCLLGPLQEQHKMAPRNYPERSNPECNIPERNNPDSNPKSA